MEAKRTLDKAIRMLDAYNILYDPEVNAGYSARKEGRYFKVYKNGRLIAMASTEKEAARVVARHHADN